MVGYNLDVRSARFYGQFSLDKIPTLQADATVFSVTLKIVEYDIGGGMVGRYLERPVLVRCHKMACPGF